MAQIVQGRPGIGAAFGTGLASTLNSLAEAKVKQMVEAPQRQAYASALMSILAPEQAQQQQQASEQQLPGQQEQPQQNQFLQALQKGGINEQQLFQLAGLQQQKQLKQQEQAKQSRKEERDVQKEINKSTQKYYDEVLDKGKAAKNTIKRLNHMEKLSKGDGLPPAELYKFLSKLENVPSTYGGAIGGGLGTLAGGLIGALGGPAGALAGAATGAGWGAAAGGAIGGLLGPIAGTIKTAFARQYKDTEEFEKLSADFIRDAKAIFGGRITDADLAAFFQSVPTLNQTAQGRLKIINNLKAFNEAALAESQSLEEIIDENNGKRPYDLRFQVEKRTQDRLNKIAEEFES